ncbi:MAG: ATP-dependent RecD-like DNA helicase, partial [Clostridiales bacterium]|nr:ATP-dependent RecD-like DNA helicase [Clostridiales bacterium]
MMEEKLGRLVDIIYFNDANCYTVAVFETESEQFSAVGYMPAPAKGKRYELSGEWSVHPRYGEQFAFSSFKEVEPTTEDGIAVFLASGVFKGVGPVTAESIVKKFGSEALNVIQNEPDRLTEVPGIGKMRAASIAESYAQHREFAQTVIALSAYDISAASCTKLYKAYGADAPEIVRENPYRLISDIFGIGFRKADKIAEKLGFEKGNPHRIKSGFLYYLESLAGEGNSYAPRDEFVEHCAQFLDLTRNDVAEVIIDL